MGICKKYKLVLLLAICIFAAQLSAHSGKKTFSGKDPLEGIWKGSSLCQVKNSPCRDETVVYNVSKQPGSNNYKITADKIVNGVEEVMGELIYSYDSSKQELNCDKMKDALWTFQIHNNKMSGKLYYKNVLYRIIEVSKEQ